MRITYTTEDPSKEYIKAIRRAETKGQLVKAILPYKRIADDALKVAKTFTNKDFKDFVIDWRKAKKAKDVDWINEFNKRFGIIVMPRKILITSMTAAQFGAPWGCAFIRCEEMGGFKKAVKPKT